MMPNIHLCNNKSDLLIVDNVCMFAKLIDGKWTCNGKDICKPKEYSK